MNKHGYLFMMDFEKHYGKAIAISVSALGCNQLKKKGGRRCSLETLYLQCYQQVLVKVSATLVYLGSSPRKRTSRSVERASRSHCLTVDVL